MQMNKSIAVHKALNSIDQFPFCDCEKPTVVPSVINDKYLKITAQ